jgi:Na+/phosphate symporter
MGANVGTATTSALLTSVIRALNQAKQLIDMRTYCQATFAREWRSER